MEKSPTQANRVLSLVRKMFNLAELWGYRPDGSNPCRHVPKYPEKGSTRLITDEQLQDGIAELRGPVARGAGRDSVGVPNWSKHMQRLHLPRMESGEPQGWRAPQKVPEHSSMTLSTRCSKATCRPASRTPRCPMRRRKRGGRGWSGRNRSRP